MMLQAVAYYREHFKPSKQLAKPYVMLGFNVFAADTDAEAQLRATSMQQAFVNLRTGRPSRLQPPVPGYLEQLGPQERAMLDSVLSCTAIGAPDTVKAKMAAFIAETGADELMITSQIFEHRHRLRSYEITAQVHAGWRSKPDDASRTAANAGGACATRQPAPARRWRRNSGHRRPRGDMRPFAQVHNVFCLPPRYIPIYPFPGRRQRSPGFFCLSFCLPCSYCCFAWRSACRSACRSTRCFACRSAGYPAAKSAASGRNALPRYHADPKASFQESRPAWKPAVPAAPTPSTPAPC
jgi:hypothetical protein